VLARPSAVNGSSANIRWTGTGTTFTSGVVSGGNLDYKVYSLSSVATAPSDAYGMQVFNSSGQLVFHSGFNYLMFAGSTTVTNNGGSTSGSFNLSPPSGFGLYYLVGGNTGILEVISIFNPNFPNAVANFFPRFTRTSAGFNIDAVGVAANFGPSPTVYGSTRTFYFFYVR
jgi:hypothetical protein